MVMPDSRNDRDYRSFEEDSLSPGQTRRKVTALIDPSQLPLPVDTTATPGETKNIYGEANAIASGSTVLLVTYTVPALKVSYLQIIDAGGENIARYDIELNTVRIARNRTYFGSSLDTKFQWTENGKGLKLIAGDVLDVYVNHGRPSTSNHQARIVLVEEPL